LLQSPYMINTFPPKQSFQHSPVLYSFTLKMEAVRYSEQIR